MKILKGEPIVIGAICLVAGFAGFSASKIVPKNTEQVVETSAKQDVDSEKMVHNELPIQKGQAKAKKVRLVYPCNRDKSKVVENFNTKCLGMQRDYLEVMKYTPNSKESFPGIVFKTQDHSLAYASIDGMVRKIEKNKDGDYIEIYNNEGLTIIYVGLNKIYVKENQKVKQGQKIGEIGNVNNLLLNNKLRFYVLENNKVVNPIKYIGK